MNEEFQFRLNLTLEEALESGYEFEVYRSHVPPSGQAKLWAQSRNKKEIASVATEMRRLGAPNVAWLIENSQFEPGRRETDLLPGQSWHQYGEAADVRLVGPKGRIIWVPNHLGYAVLARLAEKNGLVSGFYWKKTNVNHLQLQKCSVRSTRSWEEINDDLEKGTLE